MTKLNTIKYNMQKIINTRQILQQKSKIKRDYMMKAKELHGGIS